ncbi:MAG TPA: hypothetical protein VHN80_22605 [Kineosporiaceae bacterium]|nr:hypothetical protein [Kineosporiaceae bacterium]
MTDAGGAGVDGAGAARSRRRTRDAFLAGVALLVPVIAVVVVRFSRLTVSSDSVAQQSIVQTWLRVGHERTYLPPDTWLLKLPVYLLFESLPASPALRLLGESVTLTVVSFALLALGTWSLAGLVRSERRWVDVVFPLAWVGTLGGGNGQYLAVMPNSRNIELGFSLCLLAFAGRYLSPGQAGRGRVSRRMSVPTGTAAALLLSLLWVDDPYFAYLVGAPLAAGCLFWFVARTRDARLLRLAGVLAGSLLAIPVLRMLLSAARVQIVPDGTGVTLSPRDVVRHLPVLGPALSAQLGLADHGWGAGPAHIAALALLTAAVFAAGYLARRGWRERNLPVTFIAVHWLVVVAGVLANRTIYDYHAGRYLVLAVFDLAVSIGVAAAALRSTRPRAARLVTVLLAIAVAANCAAVALDRSPHPTQAALQQDTLAVLRRTGAAKGFGEVWTADLYTQLSGGDLMVSDVVCQNQRVRLRDWLTDTARVRMPAQRTFLLWDPAATNLRGCTLPGIADQLGRPEQVFPSPAGGTVLVYDTDISWRLDPASKHA